MSDLTGKRIEELLTALGETLQEAGEPVALLVVGGASLSLRGLVERTTKDVDVIARVDQD